MRTIFLAKFTRMKMIGVDRVLVTITHTDDQALVFTMSLSDGIGSG